MDLYYLKLNQMHSKNNYLMHINKLKFISMKFKKKIIKFHHNLLIWNSNFIIILQKILGLIKYKKYINKKYKFMKDLNDNLFK